MRALIGYTGFVGSNLLKQSKFDELYNSKNIEEIKGKKFETVFCAGVPAVKWMANKFPEQDLKSIEKLMDSLKYVECKHVVLISTVDVYNEQLNVNEESIIDTSELQAYGKHRYMFEQFIQASFPKTTIVRLPGLFGEGLKKNIIFDFLNNNCIELIHSKNIFQFYNLERLTDDIEIAIQNDISIINFVTEPVSVKEVAMHAFNIEFEQETDNEPVIYDLKSVYAHLYNNTKMNNGYMVSKEKVLNEILLYVDNQKKKLLGSIQ